MAYQFSEESPRSEDAQCTMLEGANFEGVSEVGKASFIASRGAVETSGEKVFEAKETMSRLNKNRKPFK